MSKYKNAYLAPLNYDRFFKKVFSSTKIAKKFIEDFLDVKIQKIVELKNQRKITDDSRIVEFDYYCRIDDEYVIIDMQQWYKHDVVYRFYIYHCLGSVLQLENLPLKGVLHSDGKLRKIKSYETLVPVITIIWMVEDNLGNDADFEAFTMLPEKTKHFFLETDVWKNKNIESRVQDVLKSINNNSKGLQFLQKNRLIFAFQKNIIKNNNISKYLKWFSIAGKTLKTNNKKEDFDEYKKDKILLELMRRLLRSDLNDADLEYIETELETKKIIERYNESVFKKGIRQGMVQGIEEGIEQELANSNIRIKQEREDSKKRIKQEELKTNIYKLLFEGKNKNKISQQLKISIADIEKILK